MTATEEELREAAEAVLGSPRAEGQSDRGVHLCEECGARFEKSISLNNHRRIHAREGGGTATSATAEASRTRPSTAAPAGVVEREIALAVSNTKAAAAFLYPLAPHLAVTIAGAEDSEGAVLVRSRADVAGELLLSQAKTNPRILNVVRAYNRLYEGGAVIDLALSVGAAGVVDAGGLMAARAGHTPAEGHRMMAEFEVRLPFLSAPMQPILMVIPDALEFVAAREAEAAEAAPAPPASPNGRPRRRRKAAESAEPVDGGVTAT